MGTRVDVAVVGAGIVGLAQALACARRGLSVHVFERDARPLGASIRNFGLVLQVGLRAGRDRARAERSAEIWSELAPLAGFPLERSGLVLLARRFEEWAVLEELAEREAGEGRSVELRGKGATLERLPAAREPGLLGSLVSPPELVVDPRSALPALAAWLEREHGVRFSWETAVRTIEGTRLDTVMGRVEASRVYVCASDEFRTLYPELHAREELGRCKLQMLRTVAQPDGFRLGATVLGGLSLLHYPAFAGLSTLGALRARLEEELPEQIEHGIHVIASQTSGGGITLGDSHDVVDPDSPFRSERIDRLLLETAGELVHLPRTEIAERWIGRYPVSGDGGLRALSPSPGVLVVSFTAGVGMSLAFAVAEELLDDAVARPLVRVVGGRA